MILQITTQFRSETHSSQRITLDGVRARFDFFTNKQDKSWYLDLFDGDDNQLVMGIALATGLDILFPYRYLDLPPGKLFINDHIPPFTDPVLDSFSENQAALYYETVT